MLTCKKCLALGREGPATHCTSCKLCKDHHECKCIRCTTCNILVGRDSICGQCGSCISHHILEPTVIGRKFPHRRCMYVRKGVIQPSYTLNPLHRALGLEVELAICQNMTDTMPRKDHFNYTFVHDGSVVPSGLELVTPPMLGDNFISDVKWLAQQFAYYKCAVNKTCGLHVHVDAGGMKYSQLRSVLLGWSHIQDQVFKYLCAPWRSTDSRVVAFCRPNLIPSDSALYTASEASGIKLALIMYLYQREKATLKSYLDMGYTQSEYRSYNEKFKSQLEEITRHKYQNTARRSALNLHSWMMRGTVEFRLKESTIDEQELLNWPQWCGWFVEHLSKLSLQECQNLPDLKTLTGQMCDIGMPRDVLGWVESKVKGAGLPKPPPLEPEPSQPLGGTVEGWTDPALETAREEFSRQRRAYAQMQQQAISNIQPTTTRYQNVSTTSFASNYGLSNTSLDNIFRTPFSNAAPSPNPNPEE